MYFFELNPENVTDVLDGNDVLPEFNNDQPVGPPLGAAQVGTPPATVKTFPVEPIPSRAGVEPLDE